MKCTRLHGLLSMHTLLHAANRTSQGHVKPVVTITEIHSHERTRHAYAAALNRVVHHRRADFSTLLKDCIYNKQVIWTFCKELLCSEEAAF